MSKNNKFYQCSEVKLIIIVDGWLQNITSIMTGEGLQYSSEDSIVIYIKPWDSWRVEDRTMNFQQELYKIQENEVQFTVRVKTDSNNILY